MLDEALEYLENRRVSLATFNQLFVFQPLLSDILDSEKGQIVQLRDNRRR